MSPVQYNPNTMIVHGKKIRAILAAQLAAAILLPACEAHASPVSYRPCTSETFGDARNCRRGDWHEGARYCKKDGGRLPSKQELVAIFRAKCKGKKAGACQGAYWSSDVDAQDANSAWELSFDSGGIVPSPKALTDCVCCMGAGPAPAEPAQRSNDPSSGPAKEKYPQKTWYEAVAYCSGQGGRLPAMGELQKMYIEECTGGRRSDTCDRYFWASNDNAASYAQAVGFYAHGAVDSSSKDTASYAVRCLKVREKPSSEKVRKSSIMKKKATAD